MGPNLVILKGQIHGMEEMLQKSIDVSAGCCIAKSEPDSSPGRIGRCRSAVRRLLLGIAGADHDDGVITIK